MAAPASEKAKIIVAQLATTSRELTTMTPPMPRAADPSAAQARHALKGSATMIASAIYATTSGEAPSTVTSQTTPLGSYSTATALRPG